MPVPEKDSSSGTSAEKKLTEVFSSPDGTQSLSLDDMKGIAKQLRRHIITMIG